MIVVVCLNPALDVTHHVDAVDWGGVNRPRAVRARPGGKGLNVARTLHTLGVDVLVLGLAGGITGAGVEAALREQCVPAAFTPVAGETRRTFSVVDDRRVTAFHEPGPTVGEEEFAGFRRGYEQALEGATAVVLSGSLPPGLAAGTYATLIETAAAAAVPAVLDTHGEALRRGAAAGPAIVKPNLTELAALAGPAAARRWPRPRTAPRTWPRRRPRPASSAAPRPWWSRSARTGCWPRPATAAGGPGRPPPWPGTRPARATRWPRRWPTDWSSAGPGTSGCGTRRRWAPRPSRPRSPGSSAARTTSAR